MLSIDQKIKCLLTLAKQIKEVLGASSETDLNAESKQRLYRLIPAISHKNPWFSEWSVLNSLLGIVEMLHEEDVLEWVSRYVLEINAKKEQKKIGIVMAGNLPLVGFHDFVTVFMADEIALVKLSSDDLELFPAIMDLMIATEPTVSNCYEIQEKNLSGMDKIIATGSDNTARYFKHYFGKYPNVIRKSRTSIAILRTTDATDGYLQLARDLFYYYGMGCRNVSKLFVPKEFDLVRLMDELVTFTNEPQVQMDNVKYINNLEYHKSIMLINGVSFLDGGFFFLKEDRSLFSPVSIINFERYESEEEVEQFIEQNRDAIQCVVGSGNKEIPFGQAQLPKLWDYADDVDVMQFLLGA